MKLLQSFSVFWNPFIFVIEEKITKVSEATEEDVDIAVEAAQKAFETHGDWKLRWGSVRPILLWKRAETRITERDVDELAAFDLG